MQQHLRAAVVAAALGVFGAVATAAEDIPWSLQNAWPDTDFSQRTVDLDSIRSGGPPKDGIPSIDQPRFVDVEAAREWVEPREPVVVVEIDDDARAYPLQILTWHEIVNDRVGDRPVAVTFCPLCNAAVVFDRVVDGETVEFGTTGRLRKSDLVMYDRRTESWWQQFTGKGIVGTHAGRKLETVPSRLVAFRDFAAAHPDGRVLSRETGYNKPYGVNPYRGYDTIGNNPFMLDEAPDGRLPAMARVLGVETSSGAHVFPLTALASDPLLNLELDGRSVVIIANRHLRSALDRERIAESRTVPAANAYDRRVGDRLLRFEVRDGEIVDRETGSRWNVLGEAVQGPLTGARLEPVAGGVHFAFAWLAFRPDSTIHRGAE
jgi:hypothetical protein